ncbi:MAG: type II toxin-antitoxin system RelE/ParE family toxin [Rickettsiales bacterium]
MKQIYDIEVYEDKKGKIPFLKWLSNIKDFKTRAKIQSRINRIELGNFGDTKPLVGVKGIYELREHYGQGFRIFYAKIGSRVILLLAGSTKSDQNKTIAKAKEYLDDYKRRKS